MGFMDKAKKAAQDAAQQGKKLAEQAQTKLDEAQGNFNAGQGQGQTSDKPAVEYDANGRPIATEDSGQTTPPQGDPLGASAPSEPAAEAPAPDTSAPPAEPAKPAAPPSGGSGLSSGDPLAG
jgi:hypothetical protein